MPRRLSVPTYRLHKQSGQGVVTLPIGHGQRRDVLLGPHDTEESHAEYRRVIAEWEANGRRAPRLTGAAAATLTVAELVLAHWDHVTAYYRHPDGAATSEQDNIRLALRRLRLLYGHTAAAAFDSLAIEALRESMIREGLCRNRINKEVGRIKAMYKWAAGRSGAAPAAPSGSGSRLARNCGRT